jgi:hypothetical protein
VTAARGSTLTKVAVEEDQPALIVVAGSQRLVDVELRLIPGTGSENVLPLIRCRSTSATTVRRRCRYQVVEATSIVTCGTPARGRGVEASASRRAPP